MILSVLFNDWYDADADADDTTDEQMSCIDRRQPTLLMHLFLNFQFVSIDGALSCGKYLEPDSYAQNSNTYI